MTHAFIFCNCPLHLVRKQARIHGCHTSIMYVTRGPKIYSVHAFLMMLRSMELTCVYYSIVVFGSM